MTSETRALPAIDADAELDAASRLLDRGLGFAAGLRAELYLRASRRVRVSWTGGGREPRVECGLERGLAVRVVDEAGQRSGFAAASGAGEDAARWAFRQAAASVFRTSALVPVGGGEVTSAKIDREPPRTSAGAGELLAWLREASDRVAALDRRRTRARGARVFWVEAGLTAESLVTSGGLRTSRLRHRVWALGVARRWDLPAAPERPRFLTAKELADLDAGPWLAGLGSGAAREGLPRSGPQRLTVLPAAAATLLRALVRALHGPGAVMGIPVGAGWRVRDDPTHPEAMSGGTFDDVGAPAAPRTLADGESIRDRIAGAGCFRRSSFRDPPAPEPSHLVVEGEGRHEDGRGDVVTDLRVVPAESGVWTLLVDGYRERPGPAMDVFLGARMRLAPADLARAVVGAAGPVSPTGEGVSTPTLVLEGVNLEG